MSLHCRLIVTRAAAIGLAVIAWSSGGVPAVADLNLCNTTSSRVGVSIGYRDGKGVVSEGWWTFEPKSCMPLHKKVPSQFIYVHAVDYERGGEWAGKIFMCTRDQAFVIRGIEDCAERGFKRTGFFEVDTGDAQEWTIRLTDPEATETSNQ